MNNNGQNSEVEEYSFQNFSLNKVNENEVQDFQFQDLEGMSVREVENHQQTVRLERQYSKNSGFSIAPIVKEHRGVNKQVETEREKRIEDEVQRRVDAIREEAFKSGIDEGIQTGRQEVFDQTRIATDEKLTALTAMVTEVLNTQVKLVENQKTQIYEMVRNLTKWIILRELKDDGKYIHRLLEKLIQEMQIKSNLLIHVDQKNFENMPDVLEAVQEKLGALENVRVETDFDIDGPGIILESDNGIINATMFEQIKSLDKLFASVGLTPEEEVYNHEKYQEKDEIKTAADDDSSDGEDVE